MYLPNFHVIFSFIYVGGATIMDLKCRKVPNPYILVGIWIVLFTGDFKNCCTQIILVAILLLPLYSLHIIGAADLKIMCVLAGSVSAIFAMQVFIRALVLTALAAGIMKIIFFVRSEKMRIEKFPFTFPVFIALFNQVYK